MNGAMKNPPPERTRARVGAGRRMVHALGLLAVASAVSVSGCGSRGGTGKEKTVNLLVAAAQSLQGKIEPVAGLFEKAHPEATVSWTFSGSGALAQQILAGAPVDVFLSASDREMDRVDKGGMVLTGTRREFLRNRMVLIAATTVPEKSLNDWKGLAGESIRRIAIGDPETVPAGMYADEILGHLGLREAVKPKLVLGANVRQVLDYVARGETDAGVVFASDLDTARGPVRVVARAPAGSHLPIRYPMAVIRDSRHPALARAFLDVLASPEVQKMMEKKGFEGVGKE